MSEIEKLRGLLARCDGYLAEKGVIRDAKLRREIRAALSRQAEPAELAPAQDEREIIGVERYRVEPTGRGFWPFCVRAGSGERELFIGHRKMCEQVAAELATAFEDGKFVAARPAQTEQQPAGWRRVVERLIANVEILDQRPRPMCRDCADCNGVCDSGLDCDIPALVEEARAMLAAPVAQTEQQPVGWQSIVLHASELADMVLKGDAPQTAQRTARALLSMLATPIAQTAQRGETK